MTGRGGDDFVDVERRFLGGRCGGGDRVPQRRRGDFEWGRVLPAATSPPPWHLATPSCLAVFCSSLIAGTSGAGADSGQGVFVLQMEPQARTILQSFDSLERM